jgi:hypothetical protein
MKKFRSKHQQAIKDLFYCIVRERVTDTARLRNQMRLTMNPADLTAALIDLENRANHKKFLILELVKLKQPVPQQLVDELITEGDSITKMREAEMDAKEKLNKIRAQAEALEDFDNTVDSTIYRAMYSAGVYKGTYQEFRDELLLPAIDKRKAETERVGPRNTLGPYKNVFASVFFRDKPRPGFYGRVICNDAERNITFYASKEEELQAVFEKTVDANVQASLPFGATQTLGPYLGFTASVFFHNNRFYGRVVGRDQLTFQAATRDELYPAFEKTVSGILKTFGTIDNTPI